MPQPESESPRPMLYPGGLLLRLTRPTWILFLASSACAIQTSKHSLAFAFSSPFSKPRNRIPNNVGHAVSSSSTSSCSSRILSLRVASSVLSSVNGDTTAATTPMTSIRLNVNEKARTVTSVCSSGTLCTKSAQPGMEGAPFGSFVDYVLDDAGNPILLMNDMSMHTINVNSSPVVTLFAQLGRQEGQDVSRCSVTGVLTKMIRTDPDMDAVRMRYSIAHTYADQVMDSPKFAFYRLTPQKIYFVGGFGVLAKWVEPIDYREAAPDILAQHAPTIVSRINRDHGEDLQLTAVHLLNVTSAIENIRMTSVDRLGMDIRVTSVQGSRRNKLQTDEFRIGFRIPVQSVEDAKSEVLKVFQEAWEKGNGMSWGEALETAPGSTVPIIKIAADSLE